MKKRLSLITLTLISILALSACGKGKVSSSTSSSSVESSSSIESTSSAESSTTTSSSTESSTTSSTTESTSSSKVTLADTVLTNKNATVYLEEDFESYTVDTQLPYYTSERDDFTLYSQSQDKADTGSYSIIKANADGNKYCYLEDTSSTATTQLYVEMNDQLDNGILEIYCEFSLSYLGDNWTILQISGINASGLSTEVIGLRTSKVAGDGEKYYYLNYRLDGGSVDVASRIQYEVDHVYKMHLTVNFDAKKQSLVINDGSVDKVMMDNIDATYSSIYCMKFNTATDDKRRISLDNMVIAKTDGNTATYKTNVLASVAAIYNAYDLAQFYTTNGASLTKAYNDFVSACDTATTIEMLRTAKTAGLKAMDDVLTDIEQVQANLKAEIEDYLTQFETFYNTYKSGKTWTTNGSALESEYIAKQSYIKTAAAIEDVETYYNTSCIALQKYKSDEKIAYEDANGITAKRTEVLNALNTLCEDYYDTNGALYNGTVGTGTNAFAVDNRSLFLDLQEEWEGTASTLGTLEAATTIAELTLLQTDYTKKMAAIYKLSDYTGDKYKYNDQTDNGVLSFTEENIPAGAGTYGDFTFVNGGTSSVWSFEKNSKTFDGVTYTVRMKTNGAAQTITFTVTGTYGVLSFNALSASSGAVRRVAIVNSSEETIKTFDVDGTACNTYTSDQLAPGTYTLVMLDNSVNFYSLHLVCSTVVNEAVVGMELDLSTTKVAFLTTDTTFTIPSSSTIGVKLLTDTGNKVTMTSFIVEMDNEDNFTNGVAGSYTVTVSYGSNTKKTFTVTVSVPE